MSYIDQFKYSYVGCFGISGVPIYHPEETFDDEGYNATPKQLVIGGGSGEHPMLLINDLSLCVKESLYWSTQAHIDRGAPTNATQYKLNASLHSNPYDIFENLILDWSFSQISNFNTKIYMDFHNYIKGTANKKTMEKVLNVENIIHFAIGDLIRTSMPELMTDDDRKLVGGVKAVFDYTPYPVSDYIITAPIGRYHNCYFTRRTNSKINLLVNTLKEHGIENPIDDESK